MASVTDIPDWCFVEVLGAAAMDLFSNPKDGGGGGGGFGAAVATPAQLAAMWSASPVRFVDTVACPTLVALGARDLRVPPSQGVECITPSKLAASLLASSSTPTTPTLLTAPPPRLTTGATSSSGLTLTWPRPQGIMRSSGAVYPDEAAEFRREHGEGLANQLLGAVGQLPLSLGLLEFPPL